MPRRAQSDVMSTKTVSSIVWEIEKRKADALRKARARKNHWATATEEANAHTDDACDAG